MIAFVGITANRIAANGIAANGIVALGRAAFGLAALIRLAGVGVGVNYFLLFTLGYLGRACDDRRNDERQRQQASQQQFPELHFFSSIPRFFRSFSCESAFSEAELFQIPKHTLNNIYYTPYHLLFVT